MTGERNRDRLIDVVTRSLGAAGLYNGADRTAPVAILGCIYLFFKLGTETKLMFVGWAIVGLIVYFLYSRGHSHVGLGRVDVPETDADVPPQPVPPIN